MTDRTTNPMPASRLPHRLATLLVCAVFPLIFVGGLVTTTEAGMAVPDWPSTYGYNLFLYPLSTWIAGPWDIFVEHGHRLLGAAAGFVTIALAWSLWKHEDRGWMKWLGLAALVGVIAQGILGGLRVVLDERLLAMTHACTGPLYFALCVALWHYTKFESAAGSAPEVTGARNDGATAKAFRLAVLTTGFAYFQLVLGAVVRHMPVYAPPRAFHSAVTFHLLMAAILTLHVILLARAAWSTSALRGGAAGLATLLGVQLLLGFGTWVVNFGIPQWVGRIVATPDFTVRAQSLPQVLTTTAHVAVGSLILVTSVVLALKAKRLMGPVIVAASSPVGFALREAVQ